MTQQSRNTGSTRRTFLSTAVAVGTSALLPKVRAEPDTDYSWRDDGDDIIRRYDEAEMREYLPRFDISSHAREQLIGIYGWIAESEQHDTTAYYYWLRYSHQDPIVEDLGLLERAFGVLATDGHLWDHEPSIVFVDPASQSVEAAVVTGYHHYPLQVDRRVAPLTADVLDAETHLELEVIDPWHHYRLNASKDGADLTNTVPLHNFIDVRDRWERRGTFDRSAALAVDNPWSMRDGRQKTWWKEGTRDARAAWLWYRLGLYGAHETDAELSKP